MPDVDVLWERVSLGKDCLTDLDPADLIHDGRSGRRPQWSGRPSTCCNGRIDGVEQFDPELFGIKRDAAVMDPQYRHFMALRISAWSFEE